MKEILYVSYDGMTDPLGQSQVIPYLAGLSKLGYKITLLSAEKPEVYKKGKEIISQLLLVANIDWQPITYTKSPPIISTIKDVRRLKNKARKLNRKKHFDIVHCRSYIAAFVGVYLKRNFSCNFVFDMRGFFADERVDGKIWSISNPIFNWVYKFFKKKEKLFMNFSDAIISLTEAGKTEILKWNLDHVTANKISVIPCCADFDHFDKRKVLARNTASWKKKLGIKNEVFVISYLGSVGTWYMLPEMLDFFKTLKNLLPESVFLFITKDNPEAIAKEARSKGISAEDLKIQPANRKQVPELISISNASLFFIKPVWSKKASSPTKMAELMGMGIPIIANANVGDVDLVMKQNPTGILISEFSADAYKDAIEKLLHLNDRKELEVRDLACEYFSLEKGISTFDQIYSKISD